MAYGETLVSCTNTSCNAIISFVYNYCPVCGTKQVREKSEDIKTNKWEGTNIPGTKILLNEDDK